MGSTIMGMNDGKVGAAASDLANWWVESVAGGVYEGIGEGMLLLGVNVFSRPSPFPSPSGRVADAVPLVGKAKQ